MKAIVILLLITLATSFELKREIMTQDEVSAIPWPYTVCGTGDWTITGLTLDSTPKRNTNDDIVVVTFFFIIDWNF